MVTKPNRRSALLTDLYELTMAAAYFENRVGVTASFELFVRQLPPERGYLLAAGLEQALEFLEEVRFNPDEIEFLRRQAVFGRVGDEFFDYLRAFRFTGEVWAIPEGTPVFAEEPLLRVTAPIIEGQLVETCLLSTLAFQTLIATKAARVAGAAGGRGVVEFGTRRAHGPEAGTLAARAAYVGGCIGTSNVEAGFRFGIPTYGTLAHSFVMAYDDEGESFRQFSRIFPDHATLLIDTYDTLGAIDKIIRLGLRPRGVRLDSGDLVALSKVVRRKLDQAGLTETRIFASGDLNEYAIADGLREGAPVDFFGVGTELATSKDVPALGTVYKLVQLNDGGALRSRAKFSEDKRTYPGCKQVFRFHDGDGLYKGDIIGLAEESYPEGEALLQSVMRAGRRTEAAPALEKVRERAKEKLSLLPASYRQLRSAPPYPVRPSPALEALLEEVRHRMLQPAAEERAK
ncbi:MAG: nicotinate phosphoribosyltransferase [Candidatus Acidiferrales bacterium]